MVKQDGATSLVPFSAWIRAASLHMGGENLKRKQLCVYWYDSVHEAPSNGPNALAKPANPTVIGTWRSATIIDFDLHSCRFTVKYHTDHKKQLSYLYLPLTLLHFARMPPPPGTAPRVVAEGSQPLPPVITPPPPLPSPSAPQQQQQQQQQPQQQSQQQPAQPMALALYTAPSMSIVAPAVSQSAAAALAASAAPTAITAPFLAQMPAAGAADVAVSPMISVANVPSAQPANASAVFPQPQTPAVAPMPGTIPGLFSPLESAGAAVQVAYCASSLALQQPQQPQQSVQQQQTQLLSPQQPQHMLLTPVALTAAVAQQGLGSFYAGTGAAGTAYGAANAHHPPVLPRHAFDGSANLVASIAPTAAVLAAAAAPVGPGTTPFGAFRMQQQMQHVQLLQQQPLQRSLQQQTQLQHQPQQPQQPLQQQAGSIAPPASGPTTSVEAIQDLLAQHQQAGLLNMVQRAASLPAVAVAPFPQTGVATTTTAAAAVAATASTNVRLAPAATPLSTPGALPRINSAPDLQGSVAQVFVHPKQHTVIDPWVCHGHQDTASISAGAAEQPPGGTGDGLQASAQPSPGPEQGAVTVAAPGGLPPCVPLTPALRALTWSMGQLTGLEALTKVGGPDNVGRKDAAEQGGGGGGWPPVAAPDLMVGGGGRGLSAVAAVAAVRRSGTPPATLLYGLEDGTFLDEMMMFLESRQQSTPEAPARGPLSSCQPQLKYDILGAEFPGASGGRAGGSSGNTDSGHAAPSDAIVVSSPTGLMVTAATPPGCGGGGVARPFDATSTAVADILSDANAEEEAWVAARRAARRQENTCSWTQQPAAHVRTC